MTPERWQQIRAVFEHAELLKESLREQYLRDACAGDPELRAEVESLLKAESMAGSEFMGRPAADLMQPPQNGVATQTRIGRRVGPYRIAAEIGQGGMGDVYRADRVDGQFDQQVAIKLIRIGMGSAFIVERFLHERQILATLNHPNIARLLDGGTTDDGVPYLAMELIEGERIDAYCQARKLSVTERIKLFLSVCGAVQYAHQRLVIHRDIKPGNILVTKDGTPKLLDFGIAKILDPSGDSETTVARPMTPEYASPEQIRGEPVTTATDVYSLGIVLYQLLTGRSPYRVAARTPQGWARAISETDAQRPSSIVAAPAREAEDASVSAFRSETILSDREPTPARLRRRLAGDIDSILLMALRKEPDRRFGSVEQFAEDLRRHLHGLPVASTKGSWSYAARKFVVRHRVGVAATALVMLTLLAGIATTERQARIARTERAKAQKRFDDVRQFSNALIFDIHDALQEIPGATPARNLLLDRAVQYLDRVANDAGGDAELQRELAFGFQRLAAVQGDATASNVGQISAAELSSKKAVALFEAVAKANPANTTDQLNVAMIYRRKALSDLYYPDGRPEIEKALAITDRLMRTDGENSKVRSERATEIGVMASSLDFAGDHDQSVTLFRQCLDLLQSVARREPNYPHMDERIAKGLVQLGFELAYTGAFQEGQQKIEAGIGAYEKSLQSGARPDTVRDLAQSRLRLGIVQEIQGNFAGANLSFLKARDALLPIARADPQNIMFGSDVLSVDFELARLLVLQGRFREAQAQLARVIAAFEHLNAEEDVGPGYGLMYTWLAEAQLALKNPDLAHESYRKALDFLEKDVQYDDGRCGIVSDYVRKGDSLFIMDRPAEAESAYNTALAKSNLAFAGQHHDLPALYAISGAYAAIGSLKMRSASKAQNPDDRNRLAQQACTAFASNRELQNSIPLTIALSPSGFPVRRSSNAGLVTSCPPTPAPPSH